jgi:membrane-associated phospholipid phosphatase
MSPAEFVSVFYTIIPFVMVGLWLTMFAFTRRLSLLMLMFVGGIGSAINEYALIYISREERPKESCIDAEGKGFPSGHALNAMALFTWCFFEVLTRPYYTWRRRIFLIFVTGVVFIPVGPLRLVVHDHTWRQVWAGMVAGVLWGFIVWVVDRFIIARFLMEPFFSSRIARILLKYDYDPEFLYSHWKGVKYETALLQAHEGPRVRRQFLPWNRGLIVGWHFLCALIITILGITGIICGYLKHWRNPDCDRAAWGLLIGCGILTIIAGLLYFVVTVTLHRKLWFRKPWPYIVMHDLWWLIAFLLWEIGTLNLGGIDAVDDSENCPPPGVIDVARAWLTAWYCTIAALFVLHLIAYILWDLRDLYSRKEVAEDARGPLPIKEVPNHGGNQAEKNLQHRHNQPA